jgi:DNA (cytosine-5)-methyltransferase 1
VSKKLSLGREHGFNEEKSGNLFFEIVRLVEHAHSRPAVLFLENVKNLRTHDDGRTFRTILRELDRLGYEVSHDVIDAQHWVPQHRERTFIIGLDRNRYPERRFEFPPIPALPRPRLRNILEPSWDGKYVLPQHLWDYLRHYRAKHLRAGNGFGYGLFGPEDISRTLSARYHKDGSEILIDTGSRLPRRLMPIECGLLMGFPNPRVVPADSHAEPVVEPPKQFLVPVSDTQAYRQFGNAVVVDVIEHLAHAVVQQAALVDVRRNSLSQGG